MRRAFGGRTSVFEKRSLSANSATPSDLDVTSANAAPTVRLPSFVATLSDMTIWKGNSWSVTHPTRKSGNTWQTYGGGEKIVAGEEQVL